MLTRVRFAHTETHTRKGTYMHNNVYGWMTFIQTYAHIHPSVHAYMYGFIHSHMHACARTHNQKGTDCAAAYHGAIGTDCRAAAAQLAAQKVSAGIDAGLQCRNAMTFRATEIKSSSCSQRMRSTCQTCSCSVEGRCKHEYKEREVASVEAVAEDCMAFEVRPSLMC